MRIWDPIWLTVFLLRFFIHNVTYIYCTIVSRVMCVACAKLLVSVVLLLLELSVGVGWGWGVFFVHLYFCMFLLSVYGAVAPCFPAVVKSDIFIITVLNLA